MKRLKSFVFFVTVPLIFVSCAQPELTGDTYSRGEVGAGQTVRRGTITDIQYVAIEGESNTGGLLGGVAGGFLGREVGGGSGRTVATVGGALVGTAVGSRVEKASGNRRGLRIEVELDRGGTVSVVQQVNPRESFVVGDNVKVLSGGGRTRVTH